MKRLLPYILLVFSGLSVKAQQAYSITGTVNDEKGVPVPGATVFITNSKNATATGATGKFSFYNIMPGTYQVVIKMLGLNPAIKEITLRDKPVHITAILTESINTLNTVNINAKKKTIPAAERANYLEMFLKNFIGETVNAEKCKLLNPKVLNYQYNSDTRILKVNADDFLIVENKALGYNIKYLLTSFELDPKNNACYYNGSPYFVEMQGTEAQQKQWEENRRLAYLSSSRHFFRAFNNNTLKEEGYLVYLCTNLLGADNELKYRGWSVRLGKDKALLKRDTVPDSVMHTAIPINDAAYLFVTGQKDHKQIIFTPEMISRTGRLAKNIAKAQDTIALKYIYVVYLGEKQSPLFYKTGVPIDIFPFLTRILTLKRLKDRQISMLRPLADTVAIDARGDLKPLKGFMESGYWAWHRLADLTPLDYFVGTAQAEEKQ